MYITSQELLDKIKYYSDIIYERSNGVVVFEEYIALPYYGHVTLRFCLNQDNYTLEDIDNYERMMYSCVQDEFLVDFMGEVYWKVGLPVPELDAILETCYEAYHDVEIYPSKMVDQLQEDAKYLLSICGLPTTLDVWEIQYEDEINLLLLSDKTGKIGEYSGLDKPIVVYEIKRKACEGLMKVALYAKEHQVSLIRAQLNII